jgi:hypothetical protein
VITDVARSLVEEYVYKLVRRGTLVRPAAFTVAMLCKEQNNVVFSL